MDILRGTACKIFLYYLIAERWRAWARHLQNSARDGTGWQLTPPQAAPSGRTHTPGLCLPGQYNLITARRAACCGACTLRLYRNRTNQAFRHVAPSRRTAFINIQNISVVITPAPHRTTNFPRACISFCRVPATSPATVTYTNLCALSPQAFLGSIALFVYTSSHHWRRRVFGRPPSLGAAPHLGVSSRWRPG